MLTTTRHTTQTSQSCSHLYHEQRVPQVRTLAADAVAPARGIVVGVLLSAAMWATSIGLALRFIG